MRQGFTFALWGTLVAVVGCGSDGDGSSNSSPTPIDISGVYAVTHHTYSASSCDAEGADVADYTHFQAVTGRSGYSVVECGSADPASCPLPEDAPFNGQYIAGFDTPEADGWSLELAWVSTTSGCHLGYDSQRAVLSGAELNMEVRSYGEDADLTGSACSAAEATRRGASMPCDEFVVVDGTRL